SPATRRELNELLQLQRQRGADQVALAQLWDPQGGAAIWEQVLLDTVKSTKTNPVLTARAIALLNAAMADAAVASWNAKFRFRRPQPRQLDRRITPLSLVSPALPSYPSEH